MEMSGSSKVIERDLLVLEADSAASTGPERLRDHWLRDQMRQRNF